MTWSDVFKIVLGGILVLFGNVLVQWWTDQREKKKLQREAGTSALLIAVALERFAEQCIKMYEERRLFDQSGGHDGVEHTSLPDEPEFGDKIDWTSFDLSLANDAMTFGYLIRNRSENVIEVSNDEGHDEAAETLLQWLLEAAREAVNIASEARLSHRLKQRDDQECWEVSARLEGYEGDYFRKRKREREARNLEMVIDHQI